MVYQVMHILSAVALFTALGFLCTAIGSVEQGWFKLQGDVEITILGIPTRPLEVDCQLGTLKYRCGDVERDLGELPTALFDPPSRIAKAGECALAFCCIALPFVLVAAICSVVRGFKLSGAKVLSTVALACSWLSFLFLIFPWTVYLGAVEDQIKDDISDPHYAWAFAFLAWILSLFGGIFMTVAAVQKGDGSFSSSGTYHS
mmetsp:Transcript_657/g.880  ORF Transcript_657/g.880 Transcript_657/m.880 type:complete len:202 (-) Transcript_657:64-669(-)